jgi:hypothetical protein
MPCTGRLTLRKETWYPLYRRLGGPQGQSGLVRKISPPTGNQSSDLPARSEAPYQLSYPNPSFRFHTTIRSDSVSHVNESSTQFMMTVTVIIVSSNYHKTIKPQPYKTWNETCHPAYRVQLHNCILQSVQDGKTDFHLSFFSNQAWFHLHKEVLTSQSSKNWSPYIQTL